MRRELNGRMVSLNGGMRRMLTKDKYDEIKALDEYEQSLDGYGKGIRYDLQGLQKLNPIQVGTYLGVIYWDGTKPAQVSITLDNKRYIWIDSEGLNVTGAAAKYTKPGYIVVDGTVVGGWLDPNDKGAAVAHIAALQLHKAGAGDEFSRFYWDGVSEPPATSTVYNSYITGAYQYIKGINTTTIQYGIGDGSKQSNVQGANWYNIKELSKGEFNVIPVNLVNRAGAKPVLWVYDSPNKAAIQPASDMRKIVNIDIV